MTQSSHKSLVRASIADSWTSGTDFHLRCSETLISENILSAVVLSPTDGKVAGFIDMVLTYPQFVLSLF